MRYPGGSIRRALLAVLYAALLLGIVQAGIICWHIVVASGQDLSSGSAWLVLTVVPLALLSCAALVVIVRTRRMVRAEAKIWLCPGLDRQLFEQAPAGMLLSSADGRVRAVNAAYSLLTGFTETQLLGRDDAFQRVGSLDGSEFIQMHSQLREQGYWHGQLWLRKPSGEALAFKASRLTLADGENVVRGYLTLAQETGIGNDAQRLMLWQAHHDTLTKLPNINLFQERLDRFLVTQSTGESGAVMAISLDGFTNVNDSMGYAAGDQVLMESGHRIALAVRETDTVARIGGDRFNVLLAGVAGDDEIGRVVNRIVEAMGQPFFVRGRELFVTASTGVVGLPATDAHSIGYGEVLQRADSARAQARQAGGNRAVYFEPAMTERAQARYELETCLRRAVLGMTQHPGQEPQFELYFQPLVDQYTLSVVSFEALLRWHHPERGFVSPGEFIPLAEETGLIVDLGLWIVSQAHAQIREWDRRGFDDLRLSINISTRQLRDVADVARLVAGLRAVETSRLTLEITESLLIADQDLYRDFLRQARGLGAKIALDDFGTGYSSLSYLRDYRFDVLKIDRVFISGLGIEDGVVDEDAKNADRNLVASIISLGEILELEVVAEGVERKEELDALAELGCGLIQGFYFGKPMNAPDAMSYLLSATRTGDMRAADQAKSA